jgi:hypothetical protein
MPRSQGPAVVAVGTEAIEHGEESPALSA